jgi:hypothetical protein
VPGDYPDFGYYFLRLASDRLLQNNARLEGIIEQDKVKLQAAAANARGDFPCGMVCRHGRVLIAAQPNDEENDPIPLFGPAKTGDCRPNRASQPVSI